MTADELKQLQAALPCEANSKILAKIQDQVCNHLTGDIREIKTDVAWLKALWWKVIVGGGLGATVTLVLYYLRG